MRSLFADRLCKEETSVIDDELALRHLHGRRSAVEGSAVDGELAAVDDVNSVRIVHPRLGVHNTVAFDGDLYPVNAEKHRRIRIAVPFLISDRKRLAVEVKRHVVPDRELRIQGVHIGTLRIDRDVLLELDRAAVDQRKCRCKFFGRSGVVLRLRAADLSVERSAVDDRGRIAVDIDVIMDKIGVRSAVDDNASRVICPEEGIAVVDIARKRTVIENDRTVARSISDSPKIGLGAVAKRIGTAVDRQRAAVRRNEPVDAAIDRRVVDDHFRIRIRRTAVCDCIRITAFRVVIADGKVAALDGHDAVVAHGVSAVGRIGVRVIGVVVTVSAACNGHGAVIDNCMTSLRAYLCGIDTGILIALDGHGAIVDNERACIASRKIVSFKRKRDRLSLRDNKLILCRDIRRQADVTRAEIEERFQLFARRRVIAVRCEFDVLCAVPIEVNCRCGGRRFIRRIGIGRAGRDFHFVRRVVRHREHDHRVEHTALRVIFIAICNPGNPDAVFSVFAVEAVLAVLSVLSVFAGLALRTCRTLCAVLAVLTVFTGLALRACGALLALFALLAFFALGTGFTLVALVSLVAFVAFVAFFALFTLFAFQALEPFGLAAFKAVLHGDLIGGLAVLRFPAGRKRHAQRSGQTERRDRFPDSFHTTLLLY